MLKCVAAWKSSTQRLIPIKVIRFVASGHIASDWQFLDETYTSLYWVRFSIWGVIGAWTILWKIDFPNSCRRQIEVDRSRLSLDIVRAWPHLNLYGTSVAFHKALPQTFKRASPQDSVDRSRSNFFLTRLCNNSLKWGSDLVKIVRESDTIFGLCLSPYRHYRQQSLVSLPRCGIDHNLDSHLQFSLPSSGPRKRMIEFFISRYADFRRLIRKLPSSRSTQFLSVLSEL